MGHPSRRNLDRRLSSAIRPVLETLENRQLLSVAPTLDADTGLLTVTGTERNDMIRFKVTDATTLKVVVNKSVSFFEQAKVQKIQVNALGGNDHVTVFQIGATLATPMEISGGRGNDVLGGAAGNDSISGDAGNDVLAGNGGDDLLLGGDGHDKIMGGAGNDDLRGGLGNDILLKSAGTDKLDGGKGRNKITKGAEPAFTTETYTGDVDIWNDLTPAKLRQAYGLGDLTNKSYTNRGQGTAIAIVIPYHAPTALTDLQTFSAKFGLPIPSSDNFRVVYATGQQPLVDETWAAEALLGSQWAHAIAPASTIYLVEAQTESSGDVAQAVEKATEILQKNHNGGVVSLSMAISTETNADEIFESTFNSPKAKNVTFVAAAGNTAAPSVLSTNPRVTSVGGTQLTVDLAGNRTPGYVSYTGVTPYQTMFQPTVTNPGSMAGGERAWNTTALTGSTTLSIPAWQSNRGVAGTTRQVPDVAMAVGTIVGNATVINGVTVGAGTVIGMPTFNSQGLAGDAGWDRLTGTSAAAPQFAALIALANQLRRSKGYANLGAKTNQMIYKLAGTGGNRYFNDITVDSGGTAIAAGWDNRTGWGTPNAQNLLPAMSGQKLTLVNRQVQATTSLWVNVYNTPPIPPTSGTVVFDVPEFSLWSVLSTGKTRLTGYNTLSMPAFRLVAANPDLNSGVPMQSPSLVVSFFGINSQTGRTATISNRSVTWAFPGAIFTTSNPEAITLVRNGNVVTGYGYYYCDLTGQVNSTVYRRATMGLVKFVGKVSANGKVSGKFFSVNPDGSEVKYYPSVPPGTLYEDYPTDLEYIKGAFKTI